MGTHIAANLDFPYDRFRNTFTHSDVQNKYHKTRRGIYRS